MIKIKLKFELFLRPEKVNKKIQKVKKYTIIKKNQLSLFSSCFALDFVVYYSWEMIHRWVFDAGNFGKIGTKSSALTQPFKWKL